MNDVKNLMINEYKIKQLGYDFMGFDFKKDEDLSFHHLIIPRRDCQKLLIPNHGVELWNGAILVQKTSHEFLHKIELYDRTTFERITKLMIQMNRQGYLEEEKIIQIHRLLDKFSSEFSKQETSRGKNLIKTRYKETRHIF